MNPTRRSILSALGLSLPFGLHAGARAAARPAAAAPTLRFRPFEEAVREAFAGPGATSTRYRIEVGASETIQAGVQGCYNARPFAGFSAGSLRIVRTGSEPGPIRQGVRLYVTTVDVVRVDGPPAEAGRPLDFASLPPAPMFS